jgi:hypothetical protein
MADMHSTSTLTRADHTGTAPLTPDAADALARAESRFPLIRAVAQYETAALHAVQFAALAEAGKLTDLDADSLAAAEAMKDAARAVLAKAGRLDLIGGA